MKTNNILALLFLCFFTCKNKQVVSVVKFDKTRWAIKEDMSYPYRDKMLKDLLTSDTLKRLKKDGVLNLLGQPNRSDSSYIFYIVKQELLANFFPLHTKSLVIKFHKDSTVEWTKIHE